MRYEEYDCAAMIRESYDNFDFHKKNTCALNEAYLQIFTKSWTLYTILGFCMAVGDPSILREQLKISLGQLWKQTT